VERNDDVTRQLRAELELARQALRTAEESVRRAEEASRLKDEFLTTLSQELRSSLATILGWANLVRENRRDLAAAEGLVEIENDAQSQRRVVDELLDVSRIITGNLRIDTEPVDLALLAGDVVASVRRAAAEKELTIEIESRGGACRLAGDSARLRQILSNLLSNAVDSTPAHGRVAVLLEQHGDRVVLRVTDSGKGIEPSLLARMFEPHRDARGATAHDQEGLGLGLAIVRHLTEMHGGTVAAESAGLGAGATFTITLPVRPFSAPIVEGVRHERSQAAPSRMRERRLSALSVLIVEDEADSRELIELLLASEGASVRSAESALEALAILEDARPDIVLSDIGMPGRDGYWLAREIRTRCPGIATVALTAFSAQDDIERAMAAGFDHHVGKPVDPEQLVRALTACRPTSGPRRSSTAA
jgi:CheY-like chemotaxis protein